MTSSFFTKVPDLTALSELIHLSRVQNVAGVEETQTAVVVTPETLSGQISRRRVYKTLPPPKVQAIMDRLRELT